MPRIHCLYIDCNFIDASYCTAPTVEIDPDMGCATYVPIGEVDAIDEAWEEDDDDDEYGTWETEDLDLDDDEDDITDEEDDDWLDD